MTRIRIRSSPSRRLLASASVLVVVAAFTSSRTARADIAAPEYCPSNDSIGQSCTTAGPDFDQDGTCQEVACDGGGGPCGLICELAPDAGPITNPPDGGPDGSDDSGPTPDDAGPTKPPPDDAGPTPPPANPDSGTTTLPLGSDAGATTDAGTNSNGANSGSTLEGASSCSTIGAGLGGEAGGGFFVLGALGAIVAGVSRRRRKT
jgi:hypothetical protein